MLLNPYSITAEDSAPMMMYLMPASLERASRSPYATSTYRLKDSSSSAIYAVSSSRDIAIRFIPRTLNSSSP